MKLYFEDTYLGDSYLNVSNQDTLSISLGREKGVVVSKNKMTDFRNKQSLGSNKVDSRGYEITVINTKRQAINLTVEDQFPVSKAKEIEVNDQEAEEAEINRETGKITCKLKLDPNKEKILKHKFPVKSPKGMVLNPFNPCYPLSNCSDFLRTILSQNGLLSHESRTNNSY